MELDNLKSAWQDNAFPLPPTKEKKMTEINKMIESNVNYIIQQQSNRFLRLMLHVLVLSVIVIVVTYVPPTGTPGEEYSSNTGTIIGIFLPLFLFAWSRYRATRSLSIESTIPIRQQLPHALRLLRRNRRAETGFSLLITFVWAVGFLLVVTSGVTNALIPMAFALILAIITSVRTWRGYKIKLAELVGYSKQLEEVGNRSISQL